MAKVQAERVSTQQLPRQLAPALLCRICASRRIAVPFKSACTHLATRVGPCLIEGFQVDSLS
jgi:hypothetical protein